MSRVGFQGKSRAARAAKKWKNTKIPKVDVKEGKCVHLRFLFLNVLNPTQCKAVTAATAKQFWSAQRQCAAENILILIFFSLFYTSIFWAMAISLISFIPWLKTIFHSLLHPRKMFAPGILYSVIWISVLIGLTSIFNISASTVSHTLHHTLLV